MNISKVAREKEKLSTDAGRSVEEAADLVQHALVEIRTMSHLLHPPLLITSSHQTSSGSHLIWRLLFFASSRNVLQMFTVILGVGRLRFAWLGGMAVNISRLATRVKASL